VYYNKKNEILRENHDMKHVALTVAILSILFSQNAVTAQETIKKESEECPQLTACKASWTNAKNLNDKDSYKACHTTACPQEKKMLEGCSKEDITAIEAYNLHCRTERRKIENNEK
jgi:hypothetical protein